MDTAFYVLDFIRHGLDPLAPAVCWMGTHRTLLLEMPLPELVVAAPLRWIGSESVTAMRLVFFVFFLVAVLGFRLAAREIAGSRRADLATLIFATAPLAIFYSRAVHIDLFALGSSYWMLAFGLRGLRSRQQRWLVWSALAGLPGWWVKAPDVWFTWLLLPLVARQRGRLRVLLSTLPLATLGPLGFLAWHRFASRINAEAPDWFFIPGYRRFVDMSDWYFGSLGERFDPARWWQILDRLLLDLPGLSLLVAGVLAAVLTRSKPLGRATSIAAAWLVGGVLHILIFFPLNVSHAYYQLPLLAPIALASAFAIDAVLRQTRRVAGERRELVSTATIVVLLTVFGALRAERNLFRDPMPIVTRAAARLRAETPAGSLGVVAAGNLDPRSPLMLFPAAREGWSLRDRDLSPDVVERLRAAGASWLAVVPSRPLSAELERDLGRYPVRKFRVFRRRWLWIYDLEAAGR